MNLLDRSIMGTILVLAASLLTLHANASAGQQALLLVLDGLRPDYVTKELMPNLEEWSRSGIICRTHHSVFPTVTRVNSSSIATGCYPSAHGLLGNKVFFPTFSPTEGLDTSNRKILLQIEADTGGKLLTVPSLGEYLRDHGKRLLVVSSGSSGSATLLNHKGCGDGIIHPEFIVPETRWNEVIQAVGEPPKEDLPNKALNRWAVDACLRFGFRSSGPEVIVLWISDPDHTAHKAGIGSTRTNEALRAVDEEFARVLSDLKSKDLLQQTNIIVTSDHGFSTHIGRKDLQNWLIANRLKESADSDDVVVVAGAIYVEGHNPEKIRRIVELLQRTDWTGAIFTRAKSTCSPEGGVPGTLSLGLARWNHDRSADILMSADWTSEANENGWPGATTQQGVAGHGTSSPFDIHNTLLVGGPAFKPVAASDVPSGNVDLAPTVCRLLGLDPPPWMQGRVLVELMKDGPLPETVQVVKRTHRSEASWAGGRYVLELLESLVEGHSYLDLTRVVRKVESKAP